MDQSIIKQEKIKACRICDAENFKPVILLNQMPFTDEFISKEKIGQEFLANIEIVVCQKCGCAQNVNNTDMGDYYFDYTYSVQSSGFAINFMRTLAQRIKDSYFRDSNSLSAIEMGSGTGEQLLELKKIGFDVLGIEPSKKLVDYANSIGVQTLLAFFDENTPTIVPEKFKLNDLIISSYTFDHIPYPVAALKAMHAMLKQGGIIVHEVHNLELIRQRNEFCLFEHEHYTYLNEKTITYLFNQNKFDVITFDLLSEKEKRGNSLLVVARKADHIIESKVDVKNEIEKLTHLNAEIKKSIERVDEWLSENKNLKVVAYGAGGRGIMTIAALNHPEHIQYIVDKNPKADNIFAPKSHLPVYGIDELGKNRADKILIFSFGYYNEIVTELGEKFGYKPEQFISILELLQFNHA